MDISNILKQTYDDPDSVRGLLAQFFQPEVTVVNGDEFGTYHFTLQPDVVEWFEDVFYNINPGSVTDITGLTTCTYLPSSHEIHLNPNMLGKMIGRSDGPTVAILRAVVRLAAQYDLHINPPPPPPPPEDITFQLY